MSSDGREWYPPTSPQLAARIACVSEPSLRAADMRLKASSLRRWVRSRAGGILLPLATEDGDTAPEGSVDVLVWFDGAQDAGFWIIQVSSKAEAVEWARRVPFREGELEVRLVAEEADFR